MKAGEPTSAPDVGVDVDGMAKVERKVGSLLRSVAAYHDFARLVGKGGAKFFVNQSEGMLLGNRNVMLKVGVNKDV